MDSIDINGFYKPFDNLKKRTFGEEDLFGGYESPITMIASQVETKMENDVMSVIQNYGIQVDKDELIKALNYDRQQYDKGYRDGQANPPQAEWVDDFECYGALYHKCSHCHFSILRAAHESFCPHCGRKMSNVANDRI